MTPCIDLVRKAGIPHTIHEYEHDPAVKSYGTEASIKLGIAEDRVFKTLVVSLATRELAVAVIPVSSTLNLKQMAKACGAKKAGMADKNEVQRTTGYVLGGVSPLGQKKQLKTIIDTSAQQHPGIFISAGRRGLEIELQPEDLRQLSNATFANLCQT